VRHSGQRGDRQRTFRLGGGSPARKLGGQPRPTWRRRFETSADRRVPLSSIGTRTGKNCLTCPRESSDSGYPFSHARAVRWLPSGIVPQAEPAGVERWLRELELDGDQLVAAETRAR
jgi:hypothetical protein